MKPGFVLVCFIVSFVSSSAQSIDQTLIPKGSTDASKVYTISDRMALYKVPGVSITIFDSGRIISNNVYGFADNTSKIKLDSTAKFQAASISKPVTALAVLLLVQKLNLDLDRDVNEYLKTWKLRENRYMVTEKVTIRRLLNHTAGVVLAGYGGYKKGDRIPSLDDVLDGKGNGPAIRAVDTPGRKYAYTGGGYLILQKLIEDQTGTAFASYMQKNILTPLGMTNSTFELEPQGSLSFAHNTKGDPYPGGWYRMPESAPGGLWTTGADLARFCLALQRAYDGKEQGPISQAMVESMVTTTGTYGLGLAVGGKEDNVYYYHGGKNRGYNNVILDFYKRGLGIVILTNADRGDELRDEILRSFARFYKVPVMGQSGQ